MQELNEHAVVALMDDLPEHRLVRGQVGTVVAVWAPGVYEVEFQDEGGRTYAMVAISGDKLMELHFQPYLQAA